VQDDFRNHVESCSLNFGIPLRVRAGHFRQGQSLHRSVRSRCALFPIQVPGMELRGGLMYAGRGRYPTRQAQPLNNVAPRGGFAYSITEKTVIRGGYGLYWVPPITDIAEAMIGARGYSASTTCPVEHGWRVDAGGDAVESLPQRHHRAAR
jgi:hypothetical protein